MATVQQTCEVCDGGQSTNAQQASKCKLQVLDTKILFIMRPIKEACEQMRNYIANGTSRLSLLHRPSLATCLKRHKMNIVFAWKDECYTHVQ